MIQFTSVLFLSLELISVISGTTTEEPYITTWGDYGDEMTTNTGPIDKMSTASTSTPVTDVPMTTSTSKEVTPESVTEIVFEENTFTGISFATDTVLENFTETVTEAQKQDTGECPEPIRIYVRPGDVFNITSPRYPLQYINYLTCYWHISATDAGVVKLTPLDVETELNYDFLTYGSGYNDTDGVKMYRLTGTETPESIFGYHLWLLLESDNTVGRKGFLMQLEWSSPVDELCVDGDFMCYHDNNNSRSCWHPGIVCDSHHHCPDKADEEGCGKS
ncbi:low-density lipoprotein receptor-related protein 12-like [Amphiura filiformis]|uniref:low-density lipoprotein receptor-related protein 12-like n=1 Tax=Amphiura filiformis TaxID=82378 RepID=UPI003B223B01